MKKYIGLLAIFMAGNFCMAQKNLPENFESNLAEVLENRFNGGSKPFFQLVYGNIKYPGEARAACRLGQLLVTLSISEQGHIENIQYLNELDYGLEEEVKRVLELTAGRWLPSENSSALYFSVGFHIERTADIKGDLKVTAYGLSGGDKSCENNQSIEEKLHKAIKKKQSEKALEYCEELLRRDPLSTEYRKIYAELKQF